MLEKKGGRAGNHPHKCEVHGVWRHGGPKMLCRRDGCEACFLARFAPYYVAPEEKDFWKGQWITVTFEKAVEMQKWFMETGNCDCTRCIRR